MTKQEIREKYLKMRIALSAEECVKLSNEICNQFFTSVDLSKVKTIHTFLPIISKKEVDTWLIIDRLQKEFPQIRISIPKIENNLIVSFYFEGRDQLKKNSWGILEPTSGEITPSKKIDIVLVPLLAFDQHGNRVGYGKGFYDKFLKDCRPNCQKIGLSFFESINKINSIDSFDVALDGAITSLAYFNFQTHQR